MVLIGCNEDIVKMRGDNDVENKIFQFDGVYGASSESAHQYAGLKVNKTDVKTRTRIFDVENKVYRNFSSPKGPVLIINNRKNRSGTEFDEQRIREVFLEMEYFVLIERDLTAQQMLDVAQSFATDERHKSCDSCIVFILSHGHYDIVCGNDGICISVYDLLKYFNCKNAPLLEGKPKLFFFQTCRGSLYDPGIALEDSLNSLSSAVDISKNTKRPIEGDMLIAHASTANYKAWRDPAEGSWFIQSVCEIFSEHSANKDIYELLRMVRERVAYHYETEDKQRMRYKQMPQVTENLLKRFYFFPGDHNIFAAHQGPDEVVLYRTMESIATAVENDGIIQITTFVVSNNWVLGFTGVVQIRAYSIENNLVWSSCWRHFGVNRMRKSTRNWTEQIPPDVLPEVYKITIAHKHRSDI